MNQHIKQLAEQAKEHANSYDDHGTPIWFQFYNEKFAELIVKECAGICMEMAAASGDGALAKDCAYWIKKDFGVE